MEEIVTLITNLGFPTAMVVYFIWDKTKITDKLTNAIENNNKILTIFLDRYDGLEDGNKNV